jgi:nucleotide-binding universal stress UspA family protein
MRVHFKNILCATDFSDISNQSIVYGVGLAKEFGAGLTICHVVDLSAIAIYGEFQLEPVEQQNRITADARAQLDQVVGDQQVEWEPLIKVGKPADEISRVVEEKNIDLVITATRGRSGFKRLVLGSVTERLMRTLTCPLLVVCCQGTELYDIPEEPIRLKKILVGCDFSPDSDQAFEYGLSLAQEYEAELHLAHVIEPPVQPNLIHVETVIPGEIQEDHRNLLIQKLKDMVPAEAANWCTPQITIMEGQPYDELVKYANTRDADMIVLGVRGHGLVRTLFLGSTTDRVIRHSSCPVLSVSSKVQRD